MSDDKEYQEEDKDALNRGFIEDMQRRFRQEDAEGIVFTFGSFMTDLKTGTIFRINDGKLEIAENQPREKVEESDLYVCASFATFCRIGEAEMSISDLQAMEDDDLNFGGDMGLIYELYNIFQLPV